MRKRLPWIVRGALTILPCAAVGVRSVAALLLAGAIVASCSERQEAFYQDAAGARRAGAVERGWIPDWLPQGARAIHEVHDLDTNQSLLAFSFDPADGPVLTQSCTQIQREALEAVPFSASWWPDDVPPSSLVTHRHVYYRCQNGAFVAVSVEDGQLYYWHR
jgi:hypothetical protein